MKLDINEININRYANGELSGEALKEFEALLVKDKALQEKVKSHEFMDAVLFKNLDKADQLEEEQTVLTPLLDEFGTEYFLKPEYANTALEPTEKSFEKEVSSPKPNRIRRLLPFAFLAAAAALFLFLFIPNTENELYAKHFELPDNQNKMGQILTTFDKANKAYKTENYKEAVLLYNEFLLESPNNSNALLFKGGAELSLKQTNKAITTFQQLVKNRKYADIGNWYLALCYLKNGDEAQTKTILKRISEEDKEYYDKAQQLLKALENKSS